MATNADASTAQADVADDDNKPVTVEDLAKLKEDSEVEVSKEADETPEPDSSESQDEQVAEETPEESEEGTKPTEFVKEFPNIKGDTLEEYTLNLQAAYRNSTTEALRLKKLNEEIAPNPVQETDGEIADISTLYFKQQMDEKITEAYEPFKKRYPQTADEVEYDKFVRTVGELQKTILNSEKRFAYPSELYNKAAVILDWKPNEVDDKDRLSAAVKGAASTSKISSGSTKTLPKSKVTDAMVAANRLMYPDKTDAQIRAELEPYVQ